MNKSILISIKPIWCAKIMNGDKSIEVRKNEALYKATMKLIEEQGYATFFMYCSKDSKNKLCYVNYEPCGNKGYLTTKLDCEGEELNGKVVAKFTLRKVEHYRCMVQIAPKLVRVILKTTHLYSEQEKELLNNILENSCLSKEEFGKYLEKETTAFSGFYAYHIEDLVIFDKPKELSEFKHYQDERIKVMGNPYPMSFFGSVAYHYEKKSVLKPLTTAPQNYCYVESEE